MLPLLLGAAHARADGAGPSPRECIAANERSIQLREAKKLRAAREQLLVCANPACPEDIRSECARNVEEVTSAIPRLVLMAKDSGGNDLVAVKVSVDGQPLTEKLDGSAFTLDPGIHHFVLEAPGQQRVERDLVLAEGEKERREVIGFASSETSRPVRDPGRRTAGLVTGVAGVLGLGVGIAASVAATVLWDNAQRESASDFPRAVADHNSAKDWANVSTAAFIAGGVVLAIGGVLFFTAPWVVPGKSTGAGVVLGVHL